MRKLQLVLVAVVCYAGGLAFCLSARADLPKNCSGWGGSCLTFYCRGPFNGHSCAELYDVDYRICAVEAGSCTEEQVKCADIYYYVGGNDCDANNECVVPIPSGQDEVTSPGCKPT
jgi:hypothetical protein